MSVNSYFLRLILYNSSMHLCPFVTTQSDKISLRVCSFWWFYLQMFCCRQGHTEGKTDTVFVLISSSTLYLLQRPNGKKKFQKQAAVPFTDIDFVSVSLVMLTPHCILSHDFNASGCKNHISSFGCQSTYVETC